MFELFTPQRTYKVNSEGHLYTCSNMVRQMLFWPLFCMGCVSMHVPMVFIWWATGIIGLFVCLFYYFKFIICLFPLLWLLLLLLLLLLLFLVVRNVVYFVKKFVYKFIILFLCSQWHEVNVPTICDQLFQFQSWHI